jgi:hypothetical protein
MYMPMFDSSTRSADSSRERAEVPQGLRPRHDEPAELERQLRWLMILRVVTVTTLLISASRSS